MPIKIKTSGTLARKMVTDKPKADEGAVEVVLCTVRVKSVMIDRDTMDELMGLPIGVTTHLYRDTGYPHQHMSITLPKRAMLCSGKFEHKRDSGAVLASLEVKDADMSNLRFNLAAPKDDDKIGQAAWSFVLTWKAHGDEIDELKDLLGKPCEMDVSIKEAPHTPDMLQTGPGSIAKAVSKVTGLEVTAKVTPAKVRQAQRRQGGKKRGG